MYALSQKILKSSAAGLSFAKRSTVSSEYTTPCGLEYFGTHQIPFTEASLLHISQPYPCQDHPYD